MVSNLAGGFTQKVILFERRQEKIKFENTFTLKGKKKADVSRGHILQSKCHILEKFDLFKKSTANNIDHKI